MDFQSTECIVIGWNENKVAQVGCLDGRMFDLVYKSYELIEFNGIQFIKTDDSDGESCD
ncbi:hypothetical protein [Nitratireductor basaltis]|uniref:Uncharacterized protein n=1 Tax=Nitratireductor basaltis TaxID=472175 RepID=A0A084UC09_9HYPH|nr:hypothetical protein [Nitratireductor basaltis]KFB10495.1 hypothetical protein EL18_01530 [Nitratireductor basaltis]